MAINTLQYSQQFQTVLDAQMLASATSAFMEANAGQVKYDGGDTVHIPEISMQGLAKYDRDEGFNQGSVTLKFNPYKMTQDRGRTFQLDSMDVNETNFVATAGTVMGEFQRTQVIPEIDSYRYSKIAALATAENKVTTGFTPAVATILEKLEAEITDIQDVVGEDEGLIVVMSTKLRTILNNADKFNRYLNVAEFKNGSINTTVKSFNDIPILGVPSARMKTAYVFNDGKTANQQAGGFKADTGAKDINWIIMPQRAPIAVSKTDKVRVFTPDVNQKADAWKIDYRKYHDLWIPKNRFAAIRVNTGA
jgi:prophage protein|uniref:Major capsid protein n=1 Tax=Myoviridae sp. cteaT5 TaxID=2826676 RepID=A0A8S5NSK2_9CAUD|nr:MAG TPA: major capsid protein [Myoviridae sp. cteaT5]